MAKKLAVLALASAFALTAALPASALDREDKAPKGSNRAPVTEQRSGVRPNVSVSGHGDPNRLHFRRLQTPGQQQPNFFEKAECTFTCGDWEVTCSGSSASCEDESGCTASGGGTTIIVECVS